MSWGGVSAYIMEKTLQKFVSNFGSSLNANDRVIREKVLQYINEQMGES